MSRVFLPFVPNWINGIRDTYEFATDVFTARDGTEQRRSQRIEPRRSITTAALLDGDRGRLFHDAVNRARTGEIEIPDYTAARSVISTAAVTPGATVLQVGSVPPWLTVGSTVALMLSERRARKIEVAGRNGNAITVLAELDGIISGDYLLPMLPALLGGTNTLMQPGGPDINTGTFTFEVQPGTAQRTPTPLTGSIIGDAAVFYGRYVLLRRPNLLQQPVIALNHKAERVDYNRGVVHSFAPVPMVSRTLTATWLGQTRADVLTLLDIFLRCKGRAGEIYVPTFGSDFPPILFRSGNTLTVAGPEFAETYAEDPAHQAVLFRLTNGDQVPREIVEVYQSGQNSVVRFETAPPALNQIERISWMFVARFAQDSLTVEWLTDGVANIAMSFITLENLPVEDAYGSNWILTTGYWRDLGQWVDTDVWKDG